MYKKLIFFTLALALGYTYAIDEQISLDTNTIAYSLEKPLPNIFRENISLDRNFKNLEEFTIRLQSLTTLHSRIINEPITIQSSSIRIFQRNGTVIDLLNQVALKFNISWKYDENKGIILFSYNGSSNDSTKNNSSITQKLFQSWIVNPEDKTLRNTLTKWCRKSGWQLVWNVHADYPVTANWQIEGSFEQAINQILIASNQTDVPLKAIMHDSNKVLEIYSPNL